MRTYTIALTIIFALLCLLGITSVIEFRKEKQLDQATIQGLKIRNLMDKKAFEQQLKLTRDSLVIAFETIRQARKESQEAHERTQRMIKNYEKIIFISFGNDTQRDSALSKLYPSFRPIR